MSRIDVYFRSARNKLMIVTDADNGRVLASLPIGSGADGCGFDPETQLAFSSNGEGTLTIVREESPSVYSVIDTMTTKGEPAR